MRPVILMLTLIMTLNIQAMCASDQLTIYPIQPEISPSSCLLVESYGKSQTFVESMALGNHTYLESDNGEQVRLNAIDYNQGDFSINQAILQPDSPLTPGTNYTLKFENLDELEHIPYALRVDQKPRTWKVKAEKIIQTPILLIAPQLIKSETQFFGCGPAVSAEFEFITDSKTSVLVKTQLRDLTNNETKNYFLKTSQNDTLTVGHGMCSGAFRFTPENNYEVRFSIMDECNSLTDDWTDWIQFANPFDGIE